jgi:hypothetical protein
MCGFACGRRDHLGGARLKASSIRAGGFGRNASSINAHYGDEPGVKFYTLSDRYAPLRLDRKPGRPHLGKSRGSKNTLPKT